MLPTKEIPYLYAMAQSYILCYSYHSNDEYIDGAGPVVRTETGALFSRNYIWVVEGWQYNWTRDNAWRYS